MIRMLIPVLTFIFLFFLLGFLLLRFIFQRIMKNHKNPSDKSGSFLYSVAFFHPYCNAGGGGERVLWKAIQVLQQKYPDILCVVYTGDTDATPKEILSKAKDRFNITLNLPIQFVYLKLRPWVEAKRYPYFTLLGQSLGSMALGLEALLKFVPDLYMDSMGYAFILPLFKFLGGCNTVSYVHYPTISTDMLKRVSEKTLAHNNRRFVSNNCAVTAVKLVYYHIFALLYGIVGKCSDIVFTNSSWTRDHIIHIWGRKNATHLLYPPCSTEELEVLPISLEAEKKRASDWRVLSIAQFRPEKDHELQIESFALFLERLTPDERRNVHLVLIGSCRSQEDDDRVKSLQKLIESLDLQEKVSFQLNIPFEKLKNELEDASVAIHTMWNEHFGIGIVECMAAGVLMVAHNSGGPKMDIVVEHEGKLTGYLADDRESFAQALLKAKRLPLEEVVQIKERARRAVQRFSEDEFAKKFLIGMEKIL